MRGARRVLLPVLGHVLGVTVLLAGAVAVLHELGHVAVGHLTRCGGFSVVFGPGGAYTAMTCPGPEAPATLFMGSFATVLPVSGAFAVRRFRERHLGAVVLGLAVLMAATDIAILAGNTALEPIVAVAGAVVMFYGEERFLREVLADRLRRYPSPQDT